jgi:hypothetical protein
MGTRLPIGLRRLISLLWLDRVPDPVPERCDAPLEPGQAGRLTKIEAEDLLDLLEGVGFGVCDLSYADGEGFSVQPLSRSNGQKVPAECDLRFASAVSKHET